MSGRTREQIKRENQLLHSDPRRYLALMNARIRNDPADPQGYFNRHFAWLQLGQRERALEDLNIAIGLNPTHMMAVFMRGDVLRGLGRYGEAIDDLNRAFALDNDNWLGSIGLLTRADCHARLGHEAAALSDAAALPDDHWLLGFNGLPGGNRDQVIAELRRRVATARDDERAD